MILDFGMGPGVFAKQCTENGYFYLGIDISTKMVERAQALKLESAKFRVGDVDALKKYHGEMDYVLAIGLIDYLEEPLRVIQSLTNCLNKNGHLIISFPLTLTILSPDFNPAFSAGEFGLIESKMG